MKRLYGPNLFPVVMSSVRGDGVTQPTRVRRSAGRPRTRRLRRRMQRDGMIILPGTDDLDELVAKSDEQMNQLKDLME